MSEMQTFTSVEFGNVRTLWEDGKLLFCGSDVARALGYKNPRDACARHCKGVVKHDGVSITANQHCAISRQTTSMTYIPEGDLYRLIIRSNLPAAERFEKWIFDEVLPSIRKHGIHATPETVEDMLSDPGNMIKVLETLKAEREAKELAQNKLNEAEIQLDESAKWYTIKRVAIINNIPSKELDYRRLKDASKRMGYQVKKVPDQNYVEVNTYHIEVWKQEYSHLDY